jgi:hypothetical protein
MAETTTMQIPYVKSPQWRMVAATGAAINGIGLPQGFEFLIRFTHEWVDVALETFTAEVTGAGAEQTITVTSAPQFQLSPLLKIEEVAVRMPTEGAVAFAAALLINFSQLQGAQKLNESQMKKISDAFTVLKG